MELLKLNHVRLPVDNPETAAAWYHQVLGMETLFAEQEVLIAGGGTQLLLVEKGDASASAF